MNCSRNAMMSKICLGTAQFGMDYGIASRKGKISKEEVFQILAYAQSVGIYHLDTAYEYGDSESIIGEYLKNNLDHFEIVSKTPSCEQCGGNKTEEDFNLSLQRLGIQNLYGCLVHNFKDVVSDESIWPSLEGLKKKRLVKKIGFSLYSPEELEVLFKKKINFDIVQVPYSIFDRRFEEYFEILKEKNIEIQVRSIFLQGLAFLNTDELPDHFSRVRGRLENLKKAAVDRKQSIEAICLSFVLNNTHVDQVLFGVDGMEHLKRNIECVDVMSGVGNRAEPFNEIRIEQEDVLLPYRWRLN